MKKQYIILVLVPIQGTMINKEHIYGESISKSVTDISY